MSTEDILNSSPENLVYEHLIRAICEPVVTDVIRNSNEAFAVEPDIHIISRGGDALNYYYGSPNFIPTHDWDFGIVHIPHSGLMNQDDFYKLSDMAEQVRSQLFAALNNFIQNNVKNIFFSKATPIKNLVFRENRLSARLSNITYDYEINGKINNNSLIDIYIMGDFMDTVRWNHPNYGLIDFDRIIPHYQPKWKVQELLGILNNFGGSQQALIDYLRMTINNTPNKTLFKNSFELVVQDSISGMKYVAPGDLLTDTMRMIYQSFFNLGISAGSNKMDKYIMKYSALLDKINKMIELCPNNTCEMVNAIILSRNTNIKDCDGNNFTSDNKSSWDNQVGVFLTQWYTPNYMTTGPWKYFPSQKLCQIIAILQYCINRLGITIS